MITALQQQQLATADLIMFWGFVVAIALFLVKLGIYGLLKGKALGRGVVSKQSDPNDPNATKWSYADWAGTLVTVGGALSLFLAVQDNPAFTSLSLLCGIILIALPAIYSVCGDDRGRVWIFLVVTTLTLWAVCSELIAALLFVGDLPLSNPFFIQHGCVPLSIVHYVLFFSCNPYAAALRYILLAAILAAIWYHIMTTSEIIDKSAPTPQMKLSNTRLKTWISK